MAGQAFRSRTIRHSEPSLTIPLQVSNSSRFRDLYVSGRTRVATVTAVRFLDEHHLLATHLVGMRMFQIRFDFEAGSSAVERSISTDYAEEPVITDLIPLDGRGRIALSNFEQNSVCLYRLSETEMVHERDLPIPSPGAGGCHGVRFVPPGDIVCTTSTLGDVCVYFLSTTSSEILYPFGDPPWRPKDVCFIDQKRMVVISARGAPTQKRGGRLRVEGQPRALRHRASGARGARRGHPASLPGGRLCPACGAGLHHGPDERLRSRVSHPWRRHHPRTKNCSVTGFPTESTYFPRPI